MRSLPQPQSVITNLFRATGLVLCIGMSSSFAGNRVVLDRLEASVNSSIILLSDVQKFRDTTRLRTQLDPLFAGTPLANEGSSSDRKEIVNFLVDEQIISQQFPKGDTEVEQEITSIQTNNKMDRSTLKSALEREGFQFSDYFELIRSSSSKRDLIDRDIRTKVSVSDDDIKNYFYNHYSASTGTPRSFHIKIINISTQSFKTSSVAHQTAIQALKSIRSGEAFEEVAKRVSDDASASSGGDLGEMTEDQMSSGIRDQVKKMKIGEVSDLLGSAASGRFFILKLVDVKSSDKDRLEKMKEEIRNHLAGSEYQHQISLWLERQRQTAFIHRAGESSIKEIPASP